MCKIMKDLFVIYLTSYENLQRNENRDSELTSIKIPKVFEIYMYENAKLYL